MRTRHIQRFEIGSNMVAAIKYKFSGHQTFVFRYGWLEKGGRGVNECPTLFSEDDALVRLGVGKNMVSSIQHWSHVTQLVELDPDGKEKPDLPLRVTEKGDLDHHPGYAAVALIHNF